MGYPAIQRRSQLSADPLGGAGRGDRTTRMARLYAEITHLLLGFYTKKGTADPIAYVVPVHAILQLLVAISLLALAAWLGLWCAPLEFAAAYRTSFVLLLGVPLYASSYGFLSEPGRRARLLSRVSDQRCLLAKVSIGFAAALFLLQNGKPYFR